MSQVDSIKNADEATRIEVLNLLPQVAPFRFLDSIDELNDNWIKASYHFKGDEWFYAGHFPGDPVTPGVILVEAMAQAGLVALGLYILKKESPDSKLRTLFSDCAVEFLEVVPAGEKVTITGERIYWRRNKLQSKVELKTSSGKIAASGTVSGLGVKVA